MEYKINQVNFSEREIAIISCICNGCSSKVIANTLNISPYTVDSHIKKIKWKMNCFSREAIIRSVERSEEYPRIQAKYVEIRKLSVCCEEISKQEETQNTKEGDKKYSNIITYSKKCILPLVLLLIIGAFSNVYTDDTELSYEIQLPNEHVLLPRKDITRKIDKALKSRNRLNFVVLVGEAGIGKTTIARHYIKNGNFSVKAEIDAESTFKIIESFENLVFLLSKSDEQLKTLQFIKNINKLSDKRKKLKILLANLLKGYKSWCLIYDNAENLDLLKKWLPLDNNLGS